MGRTIVVALLTAASLVRALGLTNEPWRWGLVPLLVDGEGVELSPFGGRVSAFVLKPPEGVSLRS